MNTKNNSKIDFACSDNRNIASYGELIIDVHIL